MDEASRRFPLVRTRQSNEKAMKNVFLSIALALIAAWVSDPATAASGIGRFAAVLATALLVDLVCNLARYRKFVCSVSAAVTAAVVCALAPPSNGGIGITLACLAVAIALLVGKHAFGGTGKNVFNPAMLALSILWGANAVLDSSSPIPSAVNAFSFLSGQVGFIPLIALIASAPLMAQSVRFRPFAAAAFFSGALIAFMVRIGIGGLSASVIANAVFWSCIVLTDPVTVTRNAPLGAVFCFFAGIVPLAWWPIAVLALNAVSFAVDLAVPSGRMRAALKVKRAVRFVGVSGLDEKIRSVSGSRDSFAEKIVSSLSPETILARVADAAIEGRGGAGFSTSVKIETFRSSASARKILIVNAVECDPGLVHDKWLLAHRGREIAEGIELVMRACGIGEAILAVKSGTDAFDECAEALPDCVRIARASRRFPSGAERLLVRRLTGTVLPPESVPAREGFLVLNVQTVCAIRDAVLCHEGVDPAIGAGKIITVADLATRSAKPVLVSSGERIADIAAREFPGNDPVFAGGGFMQAWRVGDSDVVDLNVNFIARGKAPYFKESPLCSRCGRCSASCPVGLDVRRIADALDAGRTEAAKKLGSDRCLACGCCAAVCLAGKNLSRRMALAKKQFSGGVV